jgi:hypothetical protein
MLKKSIIFYSLLAAVLLIVFSDSRADDVMQIQTKCESRRAEIKKL